MFGTDLDVMGSRRQRRYGDDDYNRRLGGYENALLPKNAVGPPTPLPVSTPPPPAPAGQVGPNPPPPPPMPVPGDMGTDTTVKRRMFGALEPFAPQPTYGEVR